MVFQRSAGALASCMVTVYSGDAQKQGVWECPGDTPPPTPRGCHLVKGGGDFLAPSLEARVFEHHEGRNQVCFGYCCVTLFGAP